MHRELTDEDIERIAGTLGRFGERFLRRVYTPAEVAYCRGRLPELAARFAAKEAVSKALGTGLVGISWREMEILGDRRGKPVVTLHGRALLRARELGRKGAIQPTDLDIYAGEVVGVAGLLGAGRTELARLLYGADRPDSGAVELHGTAADIKSPVAGLANGIAYSTENRRDEGILADLTVRENLVLSLQARRGWAKPIPRKQQDEIAQHYISTLNVRPPDPNALIKNLSGGNQQKVLLGRWLATQPELLILDEPTRGIDVGAKAEIQQAVVDLAETGVAVVFISSELEEVVRLSERIVVLKDRQKIGDLLNGPEVTAQQVVDIIAQHGVEAAEAMESELEELTPTTGEGGPA